jgi:hypothetical protein
MRKFVAGRIYQVELLFAGDELIESPTQTEAAANEGR